MPAMRSAAFGVSSEVISGIAEVRVARLRGKHGWSWQRVQVPGRMSDGLAPAALEQLLSAGFHHPSRR
jgi:hypothetical protein